MKNYKILKIFAFSTGLFLLDLFFLGVAHSRYIQWSRIGYILMLFLSPVHVLQALAALYAAIIAFIMHGMFVEEIALAILVGIGAAALAGRTLATTFVRCLMASVLLLCMMAGSAALLYMATGAQGWTVLQIIANIIIVSGFMKYAS